MSRGRHPDPTTVTCRVLAHRVGWVTPPLINQLSARSNGQRFPRRTGLSSPPGDQLMVHVVYVGLLVHVPRGWFPCWPR
jgi:hypothetical protein